MPNEPFQCPHCIEETLCVMAKDCTVQDLCKHSTQLQQWQHDCADRTKALISNLQEMASKVEEENKRLRECLSSLSKVTFNLYRDGKLEGDALQAYENAVAWNVETPIEAEELDTSYRVYCEAREANAGTDTKGG